jgi:hypothetical protein
VNLGAQALRKRGTLHFSCVQFFRAQRGKTAHNMLDAYRAAAFTIPKSEWGT